MEKWKKNIVEEHELDRYLQIDDSQTWNVIKEKDLIEKTIICAFPDKEYEQICMIKESLKRSCEEIKKRDRATENDELLSFDGNVVSKIYQDSKTNTDPCTVDFQIEQTSVVQQETNFPPDFYQNLLNSLGKDDEPVQTYQQSDFKAPYQPDTIRMQTNVNTVDKKMFQPHIAQMYPQRKFVTAFQADSFGKQTNYFGTNAFVGIEPCRLDPYYKETVVQQSSSSKDFVQLNHNVPELHNYAVSSKARIETDSKTDSTPALKGNKRKCLATDEDKKKKKRKQYRDAHKAKSNKILQELPIQEEQNKKLKEQQHAMEREFSMHLNNPDFLEKRFISLLHQSQKGEVVSEYIMELYHQKMRDLKSTDPQRARQLEIKVAEEYFRLYEFHPKID